MNKKQQEEQRRQDDLALKKGLLWVAAAAVVEVLLFLVNRYAIDFDATAEGVALAEGLRGALGTARVLGGILFLVGLVLAVAQGRKAARIGWCAAMTVVGVVLSLCAHVAVAYQSAGLRMLYLLVPVLGGLALSFYIYQRDFFLAALGGVLGVLGLWFVRVAGMGVELVLTVLAAVAVLAVVLMLKKNSGKVKLGGESLQFLPEKTNYTVALVSAAVGLAVQLLAAVAGAAIAYYLIFAVGAWLFALLVYYTVKLM